MSKTTRQKKKVVANVTLPDAEEAFAAYNYATAYLQKMEARINDEITRIREHHAPEINRLQAQRDDCFEVLEVYASEHPELFDKKKSVDWTHGTFGYRTGTPKLKTRKGFTWSSVLHLVQNMLPNYIRTVQELNKEAILADREKLQPELPKVGMEVVQDESFYVQPALQALV